MSNQISLDKETLKWLLAIGIPALTGIVGFFLKQLLVWRSNKIQTITITELQNIPLIQESLGEGLKIINGGGR